MSDPAEQQAAFAEFLVELALLHLYPEPMPPQPAPSADVEEALARMGQVMLVMYEGRK